MPVEHVIDVSPSERLLDVSMDSVNRVHHGVPLARRWVVRRSRVLIGVTVPGGRFWGPRCDVEIRPGCCLVDQLSKAVARRALDRAREESIVRKHAPAVN
jgi:hypothetical protein